MRFTLCVCLTAFASIFVVVSTKISFSLDEKSSTNLLTEDEAMMFFKKKRRPRRGLNFDGMIIRECCEDAKCSYEERTETMNMHDKNNNDLADVLCRVIHSRPNYCQCENQGGGLYSCKHVFREVCRKKDCDCHQVLKSDSWYIPGEIQFDYKHMKNEIQSLNIQTTVNDNLKGQVEKSIKYVVEKQVEERSSITQFKGTLLETGFQLNFGVLKAGLNIGMKKIQWKNYSMGKKSAEIVKVRAELNCPALAGTYVVCNATIKQYSLAIPFNITAVNREFGCKCENIQGMFKSVSAMGITQQAITKEEKKKEKNVTTKKNSTLQLTILITLLVLVLLGLAIWYGRRHGPNLFISARRHYQEFDNERTDGASPL